MHFRRCTWILEQGLRGSKDLPRERTGCGETTVVWEGRNYNSIRGPGMPTNVLGCISLTPQHLILTASEQHAGGDGWVFQSSVCRQHWSWVWQQPGQAFSPGWFWQGGIKGWRKQGGERKREEKWKGQMLRALMGGRILRLNIKRFSCTHKRMNKKDNFIILYRQDYPIQWYRGGKCECPSSNCAMPV